MSSSVVAESSDSHKTENTVIIFVNNDGSISVDEQTLQKLLVSNQANAPISVVRVGSSQVEDNTSNSQTNSSENVVDTDSTTQPQVNLTVEGFFSPNASVPNLLSDASNCSTLPADPVVVGTDSLVDPFLEMDPEQLERLETALQSEQAKQILGEGVTAMLDMLTSEDDQISLKDSIRMDHCYTSCVSGSSAVAGPSGSKLDSPSQSTAQDQEEEEGGSEVGSDDEEATESEEVDSEEEARYKRGARGRGRGRNTTRARGSQIANLRNKAKARLSKTAQSGTVPLRTTPVRSATSQLQQIQDQLQQQQLKSTPVVQLSAPSSVLKQQMLSPPQSVLRSAQQPQPVKPAQVEKGQPVVKPETPKTEEKKQNIRGKIRSVSQSDLPSPQSQPINKGRRKPAIISHTQQKITPRRATTDSVVPKEELKAPVKGSLVTEETSPKKLPVTPVPISPTSQTAPDSGSPRKMYPKRENRKPPAHLVEAFGPALFSTPDIPKRISDGKPGDIKTELKVEPEAKTEIIKTEETDNTESKDELMDPFADVAKQLLEEVHSDTKDILAAELQAVLGDLGPELLSQDQIVDSMVDESGEMLHIALPDTDKARGSATEKKRRSSSTTSKLSASAVKELVSKDSDDESACSSEVQGQAGTKRRSTGVSKITAAAIRDLQAPSDEEQVEEEEEEEGDEDWDSEDDPDRLWCICKKPHNNRFMICCDRCEEWFHGNCVGITKALGQQMESRGEEWSCPPCTKLKQEEQQIEKAKVAENRRQQISTKGVPATGGKRRNSTAGAATASSTSPRRKSVSDEKGKSVSTTATAPTQQRGVMCIVCKKATARSASIYCSDSCILKHAEESVNLLSKEKTVATPSTETAATVADKATEGKAANQTAAVGAEKPNLQNARVYMIDRKTGKLVTGNNAPTILNLKNWLQEHPTFEVVRPSMLNTLRGQKVLKTILVKQPPTGKPTLKIVPGSLVKTEAKTTIKLTPTTPTTPKTTLLVPAQKMPPAVKSAAQTGKATTSAAATPSKVATVTKVLKTPPATKTVTVSKPSLASKATVARSNSTVDKQAGGSSTANQAANNKPNVPAAEPIRINVRKTLKDLLQSRIQECDDIKVNENEVKGIATSIEEELFSFFKDTGAKYKSKYRSLIFNIKDPKNLALFRKIVSGEVSPHRLVRLSPEELATKELAQWREREAQHTLDMIKKNELDLMSQSITYLMKTHKGEQVIETDDSLKLQASAVEAESTGLEATSVSSTVEDMALEKLLDKPSLESVDSKSSSSRKKDHSHSHHRERDKDKGSSRHHDSKKHSRRDKHHSSSSSSSSRSKSQKNLKSKDSKSSTSRSSKDKSSSSTSKHHSHHRRTSESHSSKSIHHSERSEAGETEKTSRSSSSLSKTSLDNKTKDSKDTKSSNHDKSFKNPISTSTTPPPTLVTLETTEVPAEQNSKEIAEDVKPTVLEVETVTSETPPVVSTDDADLSDREPSSTVNIKTPDSNTEDSAPPCLYRGLIFMPDVAKFIIAAFEVSGSAAGLRHELPEALDVVGRISPETVWDYISKMKKTGTKEIVVIRLNPASFEEKKAWASFYTYLSSRNRFGVVGNKGSTVKDFYIMPLSSHSPVPQVLLPLDGPGFEEARPHLLLGIIVRGRRKRLADAAGLPNAPARNNKEARVVGSDRSYTPPLPEPRDSGSFTPPLPAVAPQKPSSPVIDDKDDMPYSPGGSPDDEYLPTTATCEAPGVFSNELEELNRKIEEQKQQIENISCELVCTNSQGASGSGETVQVSSLLQQISTQAALLATGVPGLSQLVVQSDVTEVSQSTTVHAASADDENEAYSPSRSFTPPPPEDISISAFNLSDTSNISLPSNLQEILASIQRKSGNSDPPTTTGVLSLESDPIVREYASADEPPEPSTPPPETENKIEETFPDSKSSSLDPPIVPPPSSVAQINRPRDPRRAPEPTQKSLSKLTEAELIAKANEMMLEMAGATQPVPSNQESRPTLKAPLPATGKMFYPPPPMPPMPIPPMMVSTLPTPPMVPAVIPVQQPAENSRLVEPSVSPPPQPLPPGVSIGEWQATTSTEEVPRKGISFRVEKRRLQPRWSRNNSSGTQSDKKSSPKSSSPSSSPPSRRRKDSTD